MRPQDPGPPARSDRADAAPAAEPAGGALAALDPPTTTRGIAAYPCDRGGGADDRTATYSWAASAPFAGLLSDRFGRRPLIVLALVGLGVVNLGAGLAPDFWALMAPRLLATYRAVLGVRWLGHVLVANLLERSVFNLGVLYLPSFLMLSYGLDAIGVAPTLSLMAAGPIGGNVLGGWLGDRFPKARVFVAAQVLAGGLALAVFSLPIGLVASATGGALFGLVNASSRPAMLALGTELSPRHRGAVLGQLSLTNQGGIVLGSALGGLAVGLGGYPVVAVVGAGGAVLAAAFAIPIARRRPFQTG